jgi:hypothetical protein
VLGIDNVKLMHANDSKTPLGSHVDRHANIGEGHIGKAGFRRILAHPKLRRLPFILETPVEHDGDDRRNLENLKKLGGRPERPPQATGLPHEELLHAGLAAALPLGPERAGFHPAVRLPQGVHGHRVARIQLNGCEMVSFRTSDLPCSVGAPVNLRQRPNGRRHQGGRKE